MLNKPRIEEVSICALLSCHYESEASPLVKGFGVGGVSRGSTALNFSRRARSRCLCCLCQDTQPCYLPWHFLQELNHSPLIFSARYLLTDIHIYYGSVYKCSKWQPKSCPRREVCTHSPVILVFKIPQWITWVLQLRLMKYLKTRSRMECINNRSALSCFELLPFYHDCIITLGGFLLYH